MRTPKDIAAEIFVAKREEDKVKARRTALELEFASAIGVSDQWEGSKTNDFDEYKVTVSRKMNDKIDAVKLREVAALHDLEGALSTAFSWKPELSKKGWDALPEESRGYLSEAITRTPGKVGVTVKIKEDKK